MISIKNLHASVEGKEILRGINLEVKAGEVHAIMGPNGSGKSTLSSVLAGHPDYEVTAGEVFMNGKNLLEMAPEERAREGLFLAFQYPVEIPGVSNINFLKTAINEVRAHKGLEPMPAKDFLALVKEKQKLVELDSKLTNRSVNEGFSGGEKKRNEILQMMMLAPSFVILDETDSGLDIDALQMVAKSVNSMRDASRSFLMVTHYQRLLDYIEPDVIHVMANGKIQKTGDKHLAKELELKGYGWLEGEMK